MQEKKGNELEAWLEVANSTLHGYIFHYYRGEVYREMSWRNRLDTTTNWAIVVTAAILSYSFSTPGSSHGIILLNYFAVLFFLYVESRRFRYYNILRYRVRLLEKNVFANIFDPVPHTDGMEWKKKIAASLRNPIVTMGKIESLAWRLRRNYIFLIGVTLFAWVTKLMGPIPPSTAGEFISRAAFSIIPGFTVMGFVALTTAYLWFIGYYIPQRSPIDDLP